MATQNYVRGHATLRQCFRNADISERELENVEWAINSCKRDDGFVTVITAERVARLSEAASQGDRAAADQILRSWGIRQ